MSDFISRLAARAVAPGSGARPVAPSFADVKAEPAAPASQLAPEQPGVRATPAAPAVRSEAPEVRPDPAQPRQPVPQKHGAERAMRERVVERQVARDAAPPREPLERVRVPEPAREPVEIVHGAPVAATQTSVRVVETSVTRAASMPPEEPPVRVHIGRLEVRANLEQPPPPPRPRPAPDRSEGLSLSDYLRGRGSP